MFTLAPRPRRILYVVVFEVFAILASTMLLSLLSGGPAAGSLPIAVAISAIAVMWNYLYNTMFEAAEARLQLPGRNVFVRVIHACGFEAGLILATIPLYMWWYSVGLIEAAVMEFAIMVFFLVYTFVFTWIFDQIFTLPNRRPTTDATGLANG